VCSNVAPDFSFGIFLILPEKSVAGSMKSQAKQQHVKTVGDFGAADDVK
jgi:hypothetical protein